MLIHIYVINNYVTLDILLINQMSVYRCLSHNYVYRCLSHN